MRGNECECAQANRPGPNAGPAVHCNNSKQTGLWLDAEELPLKLELLTADETCRQRLRGR